MGQKNNMDKVDQLSHQDRADTENNSGNHLLFSSTCFKNEEVGALILY